MSSKSSKEKIFNLIDDCKLIFLFLILVLLVFLCGLKIPNFLNVTNIEIASNILNVIIGALASIFGILIAIILVAFEILRRSYHIYAFKTFFRDKKFQRLYSLYIFTIFFSLVSISLLENPLTSININMIYISMFLFGVSLIILIPYSESIIKSTQSKKKIKEIVSRIDSKIIDSTKETKQTITISDYIESIEENPIFILSEIGRRTLEDGERLIPLSILLECEKKMLEILNNTPDFVSRGKRKTINTFLIIIKGISYQAIKLHVEGTLLTVLRVIESVHNYCAVNKIPWSEVIELDEFIEELLEKTLDSSLDETTLRGLHMIERIMIKHLLNNMPKEDEIWLLQFRKNKDIKHSPEKDLQWEHISKDYMRILYKITEKALDIKKGEIVNTGLFSLKNIGSQILDTHLGDLQKREIVDWCYYYLKELIIRSVDEGLYQKHLLLVPFYFSDIEECLTQGKEFSKIPLIVFGQILLILNKKKVLDTSILNEFGTVGRLCVRKITETSLYKQALIFIIRVFNKLREEIQEILDDNNKTIYLELYNQTISLRGWMEEHKKEDKEISDLINNVLSNFSLYENIKTELEKGIIKWPSLENNN